MLGRIKIYALKDRTGIRYIGKTVQRLKDRLIGHKSKALNHQDTSVQIWLAEMYRKGEKPQIILLEHVSADKGGEAERRWIDLCLKRGCSLFNSAPGGCGSTFRRKVDWAAYKHLLGQIPDETLAEQIGVTRKAVAYQRNKRDIAPCGNREEFCVPPPPMGGHNKIDLPEDIIAELGKMSDCKLAEKMGIDKGCIRRARHKRNIPSWAEQNGHPTRFGSTAFHPRWGTPLRERG